MRHVFQTFSPLALAILLTLSLGGCGVLLGTVKPVDEKSEAYGVMDLSKESGDWQKLDPAEAGAESRESGEASEAGEEKTEISDVAYQNRKNASIISLNSACRPSAGTSGQDLQSLTNLLFLGISDISLREEREITVQGISALQTTIQGKMNGENMMLRTVIIRRGLCVYDLMYVSRPRYFAGNEPDFSRFVSSLRLK
jgi:hypothetical protein